MPFENGSVSLRIFRLSRPLPTNAVELLAKQALPPLEYLKQEPLFGWVTGRHLNDRDIDEDTAHWGGILRVALAKGEKKIPSATLKAEVRAQELHRMKETGQHFLSRKDRAEIREATIAALLPKILPTLSGIAVIHQPGSEWILTDAASDPQADALVIQFRHALHITLEAISPQTLGALRLGQDVTQLAPRSFSAQIQDRAVSDDIGHDFLTWLWFTAETAPRSLLENNLPIGVLIEGPLTFAMEGGGAHTCTLRQGNPVISSEAKSCLLAGKKLAQCKLSLQKGEDVWACTFCASTFVARGLKVPAGEDCLDPVSLFQHRVAKFEEYREMLDGLYTAFLALRLDPTAWLSTVKAMREWVAERHTVN